MPAKKGGKGLNKNQRKEVRKLVQEPLEKKRWPVYKQSMNVSSTHFFDDLVTIPQGDTEEARDGDQINVSGGFIRGVIYGYDVDNIVRMTIIRWKPNSVPTAADIYEDATIGANGAMFSPFNHNHRNEFVVLADRFYDLETGAGGGDRQKQFTIKLRKQPKIVYDGAITNGTNKLYIIWSSDSTVSAHPAVTYRGTINYFDA